MQTAGQKTIRFVEKGLYAVMHHIIGKDAFVTVESTVQNDTDEAVDVWVDLHMHQLIDNEKEQMDEEPGIKAAGAVKLRIAARAAQKVRTQICVEDAVLWNPDAPVLYVVEGVLYRAVKEGEALPNPRLLAGMALEEPHAMKMLDFAETHFGMRTVTVDAKNGLRINGKSVKLRGDGECSAKEVSFGQQYQTILQYRNRGNNAICKRGGQLSESFLECCSRLGVFVLEAPETVENIRDHRNYPCVIAWMGENIDTEKIHMQDESREIGGICNSGYGVDEESHFSLDKWLARTEDVCAGWSIQGCPKECTAYRQAHALFPNRVMLATTDEPEAVWEMVEKYPYLIGAVTPY